VQFCNRQQFRLCVGSVRISNFDGKNFNQMIRNYPAETVSFWILHVIKNECNNSMPSVVIELEVTKVTKIYLLKCRLSASFRYPLLFRNETLLRRCLLIIKAESCAQHMIRCSV